MNHYVCQGSCGGVAEVAKVCETENCSHFNQPLVECSCHDQKHAGVAPAKDDSDEDLVVNNG